MYTIQGAFKATSLRFIESKWVAFKSEDCAGNLRNSAVTNDGSICVYRSDITVKRLSSTGRTSKPITNSFMVIPAINPFQNDVPR